MRPALLGLALALATACAGPRDRSSDLQQVLRDYHEALTWQVYEAAMRMVAPDQQEAFLKRHANGPRITEFALLRVDQGAPPVDEATVFVRFSGFQVPDMTVRETLTREVWRMDRAGWQLTGESPVEAAADQNGIGSSSNPPGPGSSPQPPPPVP